MAIEAEACQPSQPATDAAVTGGASRRKVGDVAAMKVGDVAVMREW